MSSETPTNPEAGEDEKPKVRTPDMIREPKFEWGMRVTALEDLVNDGSHPGVPEGAVIVPKGTVGEIQRIGHHEEANVPIYLVEFSGEALVGVLEEEISPIIGEREKKPGMM